MRRGLTLLGLGLLAAGLAACDRPSPSDGGVAATAEGAARREPGAGRIRILAPEAVVREAGALLERHPDLELVGYPAREPLGDRIAGADGFIGSSLTAQDLRAAPDLRWVHLLSAGADHVLRLEALRENPRIVLTSTKILKGPEVADHAMALLLALTRGLPQFVRNMDAARWDRATILPLRELRGKTLLILGMGGIGTQLAERAHASGMRVIGTDPKDIPLMAAVDYVGKPDELGALLPEADVVASCVPATPETRHLLDAAAFARMKRGVIVINVSRGSVVDTDALVEALRSGRVGAAGLDVTEPEPLPLDHPLWAFPNVVLTPHVAGASDGRTARQTALALDNIDRFVRGLPLENVIDKQRGY